jgi:hypothetical protein
MANKLAKEQNNILNLKETLNTKEIGDLPRITMGDYCKRTDNY